MKYLIGIMLFVMSIIAFWQPSSRECNDIEATVREEIEVPQTAIYTDSLIKGVRETFGGMIQVEKKKKELLLNYNPHNPKFHRTPLNKAEFVNMYSCQDCLTEGTEEEVTICFNTQGDSIVIVPNELLKFIIDRYHLIQQ